MRDIKFRGIANCDVEETEVKEGGMIFGQVVFDDDTPFIVGPVIESCEEYIALDRWCPIRPETLGQFTGLKDRNGVEIYEGDILRWRETANLLEVRWGRVGWTLFSSLFKRFGPPDYTDCGEVNTGGYLPHSEVIGNIYENPELLEKAVTA